MAAQSTDAKAVGRRIQAAQTLAGYESTEALARKINLSEFSAKTIRRCIQGKREAKHHELAAIADATGVDVAFFTMDLGHLSTPDPALADDQLAALARQYEDGQVYVRGVVDRVREERRAGQRAMDERFEHLTALLEANNELLRDLTGIGELTVRDASRSITAGFVDLVDSDAPSAPTESDTQKPGDAKPAKRRAQYG